MEQAQTPLLQKKKWHLMSLLETLLGSYEFECLHQISRDLLTMQTQATFFLKRFAHIYMYLKCLINVNISTCKSK